jgi:hypothetical protein
VPRGDALFQVNIAEKRPARLVHPALHNPSVSVPSVNHILKPLSRQDYFSGLLGPNPFRSCGPLCK